MRGWALVCHRARIDSGDGGGGRWIFLYRRTGILAALPTMELVVIGLDLAPFGAGSLTPFAPKHESPLRDGMDLQNTGVKIPTEENVLAIHYTLVEMFAQGDDPIEPNGPRDGNLLPSACSRPHTSLGGSEKYRTLLDKVAALFHSLAKNHAFHNGNKRTALVTLISALFENDRVFVSSVTDDAIFEFVVQVASGNFPFESPVSGPDQQVEAISSWLRDNTIGLRNEVREIKSQEFIEKCTQAGANHKTSKTSHLIQGPSGTVRFNLSTKRLTGAVARKYLKKLGITFAKQGITTDEVFAGASDKQEEIRRFRSALNRLAHA